MSPIKGVDGVAGIYLRCKVIVLGLINKLYRIKGTVRKAACNVVIAVSLCQKNNEYIFRLKTWQVTTYCSETKKNAVKEYHDIIGNNFLHALSK